MRRFTLILVTAVALLGPSEIAAGQPVRRGPPTRYGRALVPGDKVPSISGTGLDGSAQSIAYDAAKLTVVNFWATWCVPCRQEMPALEKIRADHSASGLQVIGVLINDPATIEEVRTAITDASVNYAIVAVPAQTEIAWGGLTLIPTTFLVDPQGNMVRKFVGTDEKGIEALAKDVSDFLAGRPLGNPYIPPSVPDAVPAR